MTLAFQNCAPHNDVTDFSKETVWTRLADKVRSIFPHKTAENLAACTNLQIRSCEFFLSRKSMLNSDAVVSLLDTEHGPEVLAALTAHSDQEWTKAFQKWWALQKLKAAHAEMQKQIDELSK